MPFTPLHFGPGALVKSIAPRHFSLQVFILAQILIDIEPGLGLLMGWEDLHGPTHTWPGALVIALLSYAAWRGWERYRPQRLTMPRLSAGMVSASALFGTLSHVWLDAHYHAEMAHLTPAMLAIYPHSAPLTDDLCIAAALLALVIYGLRSLTLMLWQCYRARRSP